MTIKEEELLRVIEGEQLEDIRSKNNISLCKSCYCMTKTFKGRKGSKRCRKCGRLK